MIYILTCVYPRNMDMCISTEVFEDRASVRDTLISYNFTEDEIVEILTGEVFATEDDCWWKFKEVSL